MPCSIITPRTKMMKNIRNSAQKREAREPTMETIILRTRPRNLKSRRTLTLLTRRNMRKNFTNRATRAARSKLRLILDNPSCTAETIRTTRSKMFHHLSFDLHRPPSVHTLTNNSKVIQPSTIHSVATKNCAGPRLAGAGPFPSMHSEVSIVWVRFMSVSQPMRVTLTRTMTTHKIFQYSLRPSLERQSSLAFTFALLRRSFSFTAETPSLYSSMASLNSARCCFAFSLRLWFIMCKSASGSSLSAASIFSSMCSSSQPLASKAAPVDIVA
mmetsp:Transcript_74210/g.191467  ORF Transcript_74210/g.191467 Transcript_74210/m.191467 type:complete len:271 (-) Transcript_74210:409-1221(-)